MQGKVLKNLLKMSKEYETLERFCFTLGRGSTTAVTLATEGYLVRCRVNLMLLCISSDCSPKTTSNSKDAHTSFLSSHPCSHTFRNYTDHDLPRKRVGGCPEEKQRGGFSNQKLNNCIQDRKRNTLCEIDWS